MSASDGGPAVTVDVGFVHVGKHAPGDPWKCADNCQHPIHRHMCDVAGCEQTFATLAEVIAHERSHIDGSV